MIQVVLKKKKDERVLINLLVTPEIRELLQKQADKYTDGNLSLWLRYAGLNHQPPTTDR